MFNYSLKNIKILEDFQDKQIVKLSDYLEYKTYTPDEVVIHEGDNSQSLFFILEGSCYIKRGFLNLGVLSAGCYFGEGGLISHRPRAATIITKEKSSLAVLTQDNYNKMIKEEPSLAILLTHSIIKIMGWQLIEITDGMEILMQQRSLPRKVYLDVSVKGKLSRVKTGTHLNTLLTDKKDEKGFPIVAALINNKAVSLDTQIYSEADIKPLSTAHFEGERVYRKSLTFLFIEASKKLYPNVDFKIGASMGSSQWVDINGTDIDFKIISSDIIKKMDEMIESKVPFRNEIWDIEEAENYFNENGQSEVSKLLKVFNEPQVTLVSCGSTYALSSGPLVPHAGYIDAFDIYTFENGVVINAGTKENMTVSPESISIYSNILSKNDNWLNSLLIKSIGDFNESCINGNVTQIIKVAEGFHEKNIGVIADSISNDIRKPKIICIAGPSSSGKTTFIKRLTVQLQVNGLLPYSISLDDYYVNREDTVRDEFGNYDFEALEALNLTLLRNHLSMIISGEKVKTARYDFAKGININDGGAEIQLPENGVLLIEGIHGLNPNLLNGFVSDDKLYKIFIQPMYSLPFDEVSRVNPSDLRLLRRIIRDRFTRNLKPEDNINRWESVKRGEKKHIFPYLNEADIIFDSSLVYELAVLKVYGERYLLEVPMSDPAYATAFRLRKLIDNFIAIYPDHVPQNSILREFIGGSSFEY